jgi:hypothetical protein
VRFPEALDVAVVLPELQRACAGVGRTFGMAGGAECAEALALKFGSQRWPTLMFFRAGHYVTTVSGMHDWSDYFTACPRPGCADQPRAHHWHSGGQRQRQRRHCHDAFRPPFDTLNLFERLREPHESIARNPALSLFPW